MIEVGGFSDCGVGCVGRDSTEFPDPAGFEGVCAGVVDVDAFAAVDTLYFPVFLCFA